MGENLLAPTLIAYGTAEQQERFLPGILRGDERWCQGYSEPNAGSDLANVATRALLDGDQWVINGQKVWTSLAHVSHWCFVVARTDPESSRHQGLSFLLVPMDQPGVECGRSCRSPAVASSTRCSSTTPAPRPAWSSAT